MEVTKYFKPLLIYIIYCLEYLITNVQGCVSGAVEYLSQFVVYRAEKQAAKQEVKQADTNKNNQAVGR